jgi:hypothetical protein
MKLAKTSGTALAVTAAALLLSGTLAPNRVIAAEGKVNCFGINECKGHGSNTCKGQGVIKVTKSQCLAAGGKIVG